MLKRHFMLSVIVVTCMCLSTSRGDDTNLTDAEIIRKAVLELKSQLFWDREILNINRLMRAQWHQNGSRPIIYSWEESANTPIDVYIELVFDGPPGYDFYWRGTPESHVIEIFIKQVNEKFSNNVPLVNFIQRDLIVTLEFADGSKIIFDVYYRDIIKNLDYWRRRFNPPAE